MLEPYSKPDMKMTLSKLNPSWFDGQFWLKKICPTKIFSLLSSA